MTGDVLGGQNTTLIGKARHKQCYCFEAILKLQ